MKRRALRRFSKTVTGVAFLATAVSACSSSGPYVRAASETEARAAIGREDGQVSKLASGIQWRTYVKSVTQYTGPCRPSGDPCEYIWCYTLKLQALDPTDGKGWRTRPDFKACNYVDVDLHPSPGVDPIRREPVPAYLKSELLAKGLMARE